MSQPATMPAVVRRIVFMSVLKMMAILVCSLPQDSDVLQESLSSSSQRKAMPVNLEVGGDRFQGVKQAFDIILAESKRSAEACEHISGLAIDIKVVHLFDPSFVIDE